MKTQILCVSVVLFFCGSLAFADVAAILVSGNAQTPPVVRIVADLRELSTEAMPGSLIFIPPQNNLPERWTTIQNMQGKIPTLETLRNEPLNVTSGTRGGFGAIAESIPAQTVQLEQLLAVTVNKSKPDYAATTIFSPVDGGIIINPQPTFRRLPVTDAQTGKKSFPAVSAKLFRGNQLLFEFAFAESQESLAWGEIADLPAQYRDGLPADKYSLRVVETAKENHFTVASREDYQWMSTRFERLESLLDKNDPVFLQVETESLIQDKDGGPFYSDALDRFAAVDKDKLTPYLTSFRNYLELRMTDGQGIVRGSDGRINKDSQEQQEEKKADDNPEAAAEFIHRILLNEKWAAASKRIEKLERQLKSDTTLPAMKRQELTALVHLYRGMILAESGVAQQDAAEREFATALSQLNTLANVGLAEAKAVSASRFRVANNSGNFYLRLAQDRLHNHALAMATGNDRVLTDLLTHWLQAHNAYQTALQIAAEFLTDKPEMAAATKINLARLYSLLGDLIQTVDREKISTEIVSGAYTTAAQYASEVLAAKSSDGQLNAAAHHLLADLAFRKGDKTAARHSAESARAAYVQTGTLSGVEAVERLLGMLATDDNTTALKHLSISNALSEVLREQIPADQIGLSRAGFFARRAYVNEKLVELLINAGKPVEALTILEAAKARSLQEVLTCAKINTEHDESVNVNSITEIVGDFPADIVALEYFIGSERSWGFFVANGGVEAFLICDLDGNPIPSRDLIAAVQEFLHTSELQAKKMSTRIRSGEGFGRDWETALFRLRTLLIPDAILDKIRDAKPTELLIVPQHILHYLPFAALVVSQDTKNTNPQEMPLPAFVLDEPYNLFYSPSLVNWDLLRQRAARPITRWTAVGISRFSQAPPLEGAKKDLENTKNTFGEQHTEIITENAATPEAVKKVLAQRGFLMIATHGQNIPTHPLHGMLLLRSGNGADAVLTAEEIFQTTVGADLVVLSACYSGLADQSPLPGDDLFGIQRALLHSGAGAVIAGMWDVYDWTGPMITDGVMKQLAAGKPIAAALANAQRAFLKQQRDEGTRNPWTHPYFWAVYTLTGDGRVYSDSPKNSR